MRLKRLRRFWAGQGGDTIVEVLVSIVILAVVIGAAYAISTRSFQAGLNSKYRDQALSYAQQQIELLKNIDNSGNIATFTENPNLPFCVNPDDLSKITPPGPATGCTTPVGAPAAAAHDQYSVTVIYTGNGPGQTKTFNVTVNWTSAGNIASQTKLYYKSNDSWVNTPGSCADADVSSAPCSPTRTATSPPTAGLSFSRADASVAYGGSTKFTWRAVYITPPCTASGAWSGSQPSDGTDVPIGPLTTTGDNVFTLSCPGIDSSTSVTKSVTVTVGSAPVPIVSTNPATSVSYNSATLNGSVNPKGYATTYQFKYGTTASYGSTTAVTSAGSGTSATGVSASIGSLSARTTYHYQLCATNTYGTTCGSDVTFTTTSAPPTVTISPATGITSSQATLHGTVNPNGSSTCYAWQNQFNAPVNFSGPRTDCAHGTVGSDNTVHNIDTTAYGLVSYTWQWRLCATNSAGTTCSNIISFSN